jgi:hypothetical protein
LSNIFFPFKVFPKINKVKVMDNSLYYLYRKQKKKDTGKQFVLHSYLELCIVFISGYMHFGMASSAKECA